MDTKKVTPHETDVLIIGSGGAGLRAALELHDQGYKVLVVGKCKKREAHTTVAQGGINAALGTMDPEDTWELHAADTIADGGLINDARAVELLCQNAPQAIQELADWGVPFARNPDGKITQRFFGAATYRRACFVGDITGKAILDALVDQVEQRKIPFLSEVYIFSLLDDYGVVNGALGVNLQTSEIHSFSAKAVLLATGGHSRLFRRSSSHTLENNGDGIALAHELGAACMDMEMFQFHPTGMISPEVAEGLLVTEATRGEGGILTNALGERFMERYAPEKKELAARDVVARANYLEIAAGRGTPHGGVYLDISHKPKAYILERLPTIYEQFQKYCGIDISQEKMEVAPTAHYSMGGLLVDHATGETGIAGLFAVGEVVAGVHGANRLGGNSLAEIMVFGRLVGKHLAESLVQKKLLPIIPQKQEQKLKVFEEFTAQTAGEDPLTLMRAVQELMWEKVGVVREGKKMEAALQELLELRKKKIAVADFSGNKDTLQIALNLRNMFPICEMIIRSALLRTESRAAHYRTDYPALDPKWCKNIICTPSDHSFVLSSSDVPTPSTGVQKLLKSKGQAAVHLLE